MRPIYLLVERAGWERAPDVPFAADSLAAEGFLHCAYADQVERSANRFHADTRELLVLHIDPARLSSPLKEEPARSGELFPHIHGPLNRDAVVRVEPLHRGTDGRWLFTPPLDA